MDSLTNQMEALKTPLVIFIILALLAVVVYMYMNRNTEGAEVPNVTVPKPVDQEIAKEGTVGAEQGATTPITSVNQEDTAASLVDSGTVLKVSTIRMDQKLRPGDNRITSM